MYHCDIINNSVAIDRVETTPVTLEEHSMNPIQRVLQAAAAVAAATMALVATPAQALTVTLGTGCSGSGPFTYSTISVDASGNVTVTCGGAAVGPGTVGFSPTAYSVNTNATVPVTITRTNGSVGAVGTNLTVPAGACSLGATSVAFADGDSAAKSVNVTAPATTGSCTVSLAVTGGAIAGTTSATVTVTDPNAPGTFALATPPPAPVAGGAAVAITLQRINGSSGGYTVPYTATMTGLTGASIAEASPITFGAGETSKTLTFNPGTTAGTLQLALLDPLPVAPNVTATTSNTTALTVTVTASGTCPTTPTNVVMFTLPATVGPWTAFNLEPGQIGSAQLPALPAGATAGVLEQTQTALTSAVTRVEMAISKCPGDFTYPTQQPRAGGTVFPCGLSSPFITNNSLRWNLVGTFLSYCLAPPAEGPWYLNVRYEAAGGCLGGVCGSSIQWHLP